MSGGYCHFVPERKLDSTGTTDGIRDHSILVPLVNERDTRDVPLVPVPRVPTAKLFEKIDFRFGTPNPSFSFMDGDSICKIFAPAAGSSRK